jgi:flagellin
MSTGLYINNNSAANGIQANLLKSQAQLGKVYQQVSTGLRVNSAKDDAAGFANVQRLTTQIRGLDQARRNAADGLSMGAIADGAVAEMTDSLQRMRELVLDAANGTRSDDDKAMIQTEITQLQAELTRIATNTKFGETALLSGGAVATAGVNIQVGAQATETITIKMVDARPSELGSATVKVDKISVAGTAGPPAVAATTTADALTSIDTALKSLNTFSANLGAAQKRFETVIGSLATQSANLQDARGRIQDADIASASTQMAKFNTLQQSALAMQAQANQVPSAALQLLR